MFRKNTAGQFIHFQLLLTADGTIATGLSPTVRRCIDGTFAAGSGTVTEDTGTGWYKYAMSQADTNGNNIGFRITATGAMPVSLTIVTTTADPYSETRGLAGTALPAAAANAAGGLPISTAGGLDLDAKLAATNEVTAARMGALTDLIDGGRLDLILDTIAADVVGLDGAAMRGTDGANTVAPPSAVANAAAVRAELTTELARVDAAISTRATPAQVNTEVVDALNIDTYAEPGQGAPAATTSLAAKLNYLYKAWRNKKTQTSSQLSLFNDAGDTVDQKSTITDVSGITTLGEIETGA